MRIRRRRPAESGVSPAAAMPAHTLVRSRRKTLALEITPEALLVVRAPVWVSRETIGNFVRSKHAWIAAHQRRALEMIRSRVSHAYAAGEEFLYLGEKRSLVITENREGALELDGNQFLFSRTAADRAGKIFQSWYCRQAREVIGERVGHYARLHGLKVKKLRISGAAGRWGSCSSRGTLSFNWRLVMAPVRVIDYVVIHELMHLREPNHSARFWEQVGRVCPDYRREKEWLCHNRALMRL